MKLTNINAVMKMVLDFIDDKINRISFCFDFPYELENRYKKMCSEDREYAELIYDLILEEGIYKGDDLSDKDYKKLICRKYKKFKRLQVKVLYDPTFIVPYLNSKRFFRGKRKQI